MCARWTATRGISRLVARQHSLVQLHSYCRPHAGVGVVSSMAPAAIVGLLLSASAASVAHGVHSSTSATEGAPHGNCTTLADQWCNSPAAGCTATGTLVAADAPAGAGGPASWRCYNPGCLDKINHGGNCKDFCTRPQLETIITTCRLPPPPPPPPPQAQKGKDFISEVFVPGELGYVCIRIPSITLAGDNKTLLAFAECRTFVGDGCEPLHPNATTHSKNARDICQKSSTDCVRLAART